MQDMKTVRLSITAALAFLCVAMPIPGNARKEVREIPTANIPSPAKVSVVLPEGYNPRAALSYPTVYLLNGHGGNHASWPELVNLDSLATLHNMIFVCPGGMNSWYFDSPADPSMQMESYIVGDLIPFIDSNYRTIPRSDRRAISGLSMGGHGALWIALRHPDLFGNAGSTSGGVDFTPWPTSWNLPDFLGPESANPKRWFTHTVQYLVEKGTPVTANLIIDCGTEDFFFNVNTKLHKTLTRRNIPHTFITSPGAHNAPYWQRSIMPHLEFFRDNFNK